MLKQLKLASTVAVLALGAFGAPAMAASGAFPPSEFNAMTVTRRRATS